MPTLSWKISVAKGWDGWLFGPKWWNAMYQKVGITMLPPVEGPKLDRVELQKEIDKCVAEIQAAHKLIWGPL